MMTTTGENTFAIVCIFANSVYNCLVTYSFVLHRITYLFLFGPILCIILFLNSHSDPYVMETLSCLDDSKPLANKSLK